MIRKSFSAITKVVDEAQGLVEAVVNSTGIIDMQKDNMNPGCWDSLCKSMASGETKYPTVLWGHEWLLPVGKVLHAEELYPGDARLKAAKVKKDSGGVRVISQYNLETQRGREAFSDVKNGLITEWSVGFMPAEDGHHYDKSGIHQITKVAMWPEVSNVLVGASPGTYTAIAKSAEAVLAGDATLDEKADEIEKLLLRDLDDLPEDGENPRLGEILGVIKSAIHDWLQADTEPVEKDAEPIQPQAATTAEALVVDLSDMAAKLTELVIQRLNAPPQHSDLEDSGDLSITNWAKHNIRPTS